MCVGKTPSPTGGTQFTNYFYVVDRGNRRIVWLSRGPSGPTWLGTYSTSGWDPTDCAVDHFGNLYIVEELSHRVNKFNYSLGLVTSYGSFGKGTNNYNTFAFPHAISVPCGLKVVNAQTVWYCEGRVVTAELWSDSTGAVEHYLNVEAFLVSGPDVSTPVASFAYRTTDHANHYVYVRDWNNAVVRILAYNWLLPPGTLSWWWDGTRTDGTWAPPGNYSFEADIVSAYGCGFSWCHPTIFTGTFWSNGQPPSTCTPKTPCVRATPDSANPWGPEPTTLFLHQRVIKESRPLTRIQAALGAAPSQPLQAQSGSLSDVVRVYGLKGLAFSVTRPAAASPVSIRVYSLAGRLIRVLVNDRLDPGVYEIVWDGLDELGRPAAPGVYIAQMTAGTFRATQHLILRQQQ